MSKPIEILWETYEKKKPDLGTRVLVIPRGSAELEFIARLGYVGGSYIWEIGTSLPQTCSANDRWLPVSLLRDAL